MVLNLGILISGNGSNMLNIVEQCKNKNLSCDVKVVISNQDCLGIKKAQKLNLKTFVIKPERFEDRNFYEENLSKLLKENDVQLICLAGYMLKLGDAFVSSWPKKIINIHPSLLPSFKGLNAQEQAIEKGVKFTGCTIHYVNNNLDDGEIIDQRVVKINKSDTLQNLIKKILIEEHKLYISVLEMLSKDC
tara:strand:- start:1055 stop:1624 length:570 start_codon:yes stop_codon:yes gene_type:complete